ncbi:MAG TPA: sulfur oxidation c-type cytochrome SoxA [Burkholderiales bacterium]|nr:sulfur oxidation c-type cytochrome SoxA [Burkholderiales bacterium]
MLLVAACLAQAAPAQASPEQDRKAFLSTYREKFPGIPVGSYVNGALMASRDAMEQFDGIMAFPPFQDAIDRGKALWEAPFRNRSTFAACFPDGGRNVAGNYPYYDARSREVVTFEMALNRCRQKNNETPYAFDDPQTMGALTAYARMLSDDMLTDVKVRGKGALVRYAAGRKLYFTRTGQYDFACASCHLYNAGKTLRTEILSPSVGQTTHWPVFRGGDDLNTLHMRYRRCLQQMRAPLLPAGGEALNDLEYFMSYLSNGLPLRASVYRK